MINVCIFEDDKYKQCDPLTFAKPCYDLFLGFDSPFDKIKRYFNHANLTLHCREEIKLLVKQEHPGIPINKINTGAPGLFINGRIIMTEDLYDTLASINPKKNYLFTHEGDLIATYVSEDLLAYMAKTLQGIPNLTNVIQYLRNKCISKELKDVKIISSFLDLIAYNTDEIASDFNYKNVPGIIKGSIKPFTNIYNENNVFIDHDSILEDGVVINAEKGPVYIENNVYIESGSRIEGPAFIGEHTLIKGARIRSSSIGAHCKISGEVSCSVIGNFSNKAHEGFIGHSYLGQWVNLGAGTTTSNLKNTYGPISVHINKTLFKTDYQFLGSIISDHVKLGVGTLLNCGTVIGYGSNLFGSVIHEKYIPPFSWGESKNYSAFHIDKFFDVVERIKQRRKKELDKTEKEIITYLYEQEKEEGKTKEEDKQEDKQENKDKQEDKEKIKHDEKLPTS